MTLVSFVWRHTSNWGISAVFHTIVFVILGLLTLRIAEPEDETVHILTTADDVAFDQTNVEKMLSRSIEFDSSTLSSDQSELSPANLEQLADLADADDARFNDSIGALSNVAAIVGQADPSMIGIAGKGGRLSTDVRPRVSFYGIEAEGTKFVYVVDRSGSMVGERWIQARAELLRSISELTPEQEFFIILFNDKTAPMLNRSGARLKLSTADRMNVEMAAQWVLQQLPGGNTFPRDSVEMALRLKPDAIFLLSDGEFRDGTLEALRRKNRNRRDSAGQKNAVIHTIAFKSMAGAMLLRQIAAENGGTFNFIP